MPSRRPPETDASPCHLLHNDVPELRLVVGCVGVDQLAGVNLLPTPTLSDAVSVWSVLLR